MGHLDDALALDATGQAELVRRGEVTPGELVGAAIDAAARRNPALYELLARLSQERFGGDRRGSYARAVQAGPLATNERVRTYRTDQLPREAGSQVALLLPQRGALAAPAAALQEGVMAAYFADQGARPLLRIYDGTKPATGGAATTLLAELTCGSPFAAGAAAGVLTLGSITQDSSANATGTATWFRIVKSDGTTHVLDGTVTATGGGGDLELVSTSITATQPVQVTSFTITEANS